MITTLLVLSIPIFLAIALWPIIVQLLTVHVIPFVRRILGQAVGDQLAGLIAWLDEPACRAKSALNEGWRALQDHVPGLRTTYTRLFGDRLQAVTTCLVNDGSIDRLKAVEQELGWEDLPKSVRDEFTQSGARSVQVDLREAITQRARKLAREQGMELET